MYLFKIWFTIFIIGLVFYPIISMIFNKFNDRGWMFSKIIGICVSSWAIWILSYLRILQYTQFNSYLIIVLFAIANIVIIVLKFKKEKLSFSDIDFSFVKHIIITEIIFILCLSFWTYIKGFNPAIDTSTEQFMDYGYMNSIMNAEYMPPEDIWLSGNSINYYYFGQYISGFICKLSGLTASQGYNLVVAFVASCTFILPFLIGYNLFKNKLKDISKTKILIILPIIVALFIGISASLGGTLHYPIYRWFASNKDNYSYTNETRYIGYDPETSDKTATEVPAYSSLVGDLHAHYIDLVFSLTTIALLAQYFILDKEEKKSNNYIDYLHLFIIAFMLGIQKMTNYWDFPIYIVIISAIIITKNLICNKCNSKSVLKTILILFGIILSEQFITLPFTLDLHVNSTNIYFTGVMSPFYKLLVKWGLQTICVILFLILFFIHFKNSKEKFKEYLNNHLSDLFVIIVGICAFGLVLIPEIVYLKDIYGDNYKRFNTMFKLTYQAYILFSLSTSYILFSIVTYKNKYIKIVGLIILIIYSTTFGYGIDAIFTCYKNTKHTDISAYSTESYIRNALPDDFKAIEWIRNNISRDKVIVESCYSGNSYSISSRISTFTGNPTVLGWTHHEWVWRANADYTMPKEVNNRISYISTLYTTTDYSTAKSIIDKFDIDYIYIGYLEYENYNDINIDFLTNLGKVVYQNKKIYLIKVR